MIIALTGHRSDKCEPESIVRQKVRTALRYSGAKTVISGMANGLDLWGADEALGLHIPVWCARPWRGHKARKGDEELYERILSNAEKIIDVTDYDRYPGSWVYPKRNEWMVDNATHVLAYMDPCTSGGGTFHCVNYARGKKPIRNIYLAAPF